jgi:hypothetical protein
MAFSLTLVKLSQQKSVKNCDFDHGAGLFFGACYNYGSCDGVPAIILYT